MSEEHKYLKPDILSEKDKKLFLIKLLKSKKNCAFKNKDGTTKFINAVIFNKNSIQKRIFKLKYILNEIFDKCQLDVIDDLKTKIKGINPNNEVFNTFIDNLIHFEELSSGCKGKSSNINVDFSSTSSVPTKSNLNNKNTSSKFKITSNILITKINNLKKSSSGKSNPAYKKSSSVFTNTNGKQQFVMSLNNLKSAISGLKGTKSKFKV